MLNRRDWMSAASLAGLGFMSTARASTPRKPALRAAHITDVHITHDKNSPQGVAAAFQHMFRRDDWAPDVVLDTGDSVMAVDGRVTGTRALQQIELWKTAIKDCKVPLLACLGNHDVWDGRDPIPEVPAEKKGFALMTEVLGMPAPYYSVDRGGWHIISLNSMSNWPKYGTLTPEHFEWLKDDLRKTPKSTPVCVLSHLPILSVTSSTYGDECRKDNDVIIPGVWQHADCWAITEVFRHHPNVKLCLSGHMHTCDRCEYRGAWYICGGAVSGAWWGGSEYGFPPCYGAINLYEDGAFDYEFVDYGWSARQWRGKELKMT